MPYVKRINGVVVGTFEVKQPEVAEELLADGHADLLTLNKAHRLEEVQKKTDGLIAKGFVHSGKTFSLSQNCQINLLGMMTSAASLTYPVDYSTLDDSEVHQVADAAEVAAMYNAALATKKSHLDSGNALKDSIAGAVDQAALDAIVDSR